MRRVRGVGDLWVVESSIRYGDRDRQPAVNILELRGDTVAHEMIDITGSWEPPEWRATVATWFRTTPPVASPSCTPDVQPSALVGHAGR